MAHILVIDDDPFVRQTLATCLPTIGHAVSVASDGETGLALAAQRTHDLVLLDVDMPRMSGLTVCAALGRDAGPGHPPVVMMTGRMTREVCASAQRAGARAVLPKPFAWDQLEAELNRHLASAV